VRYLNGKPLIAWTIEVANRSMILDKVVVSTENQEISMIANMWGGGEIITRSRSLSADDSSVTDTIFETLTVLRDKGENFDYVTLLQPTSPLRNVVHVDDAFELMRTKNAIGVVSVCKTDHPAEWTGKLAPDGFLGSFFQETNLDKQSQSFVPSYRINGAIYIVLVERFLDEKTLFLPTGMVAYVMDREDSVDIDDEYDLRLAEFLLKERGENRCSS